MRNTDWWEMPFQRCILACQDLESTDKTPNAKKLHPNIPSFEEISETLGRSGSIRSICTQRGAITGSVLQRGVCGWYVTPEGPVVGRLTVSHSAVVFRPRGYGEGCKSDARIPSPERYFLRVDLSDLVECGTVCLPTSAQSRKYYEASVRHFPEMQTESPYDFAVDSPLSDKASHFYLQLLVNGGNAMAKEYVDDYESDTPAGNSQGLDDEKASLLRTYSLSGRESQDDTFTLNSYERLRYSVAHRNPLLPDQVLRLLNMKRKRSRRPRQQPSFILLRLLHKNAEITQAVMGLVDRRRAEVHKQSEQLFDSVPLNHMIRTANSSVRGRVLWSFNDMTCDTSPATVVPFFSNQLLSMLTTDDASPDVAKSVPFMTQVFRTFGLSPGYRWVISEPGISASSSHLKRESSLPEPSWLTSAAWEQPDKTNGVLSADQVQAIMGVVPPAHSVKPWHCVYCVRRDGVSYQTLYHCTAGKSPIIAVLRDSSGIVFGFYSGTGLQQTNRYYGSGDTFVYTFKDGLLQPYHWSSLNDYFLFTDAKRVAVGGGGAYALTVDADMICGSTAACRTFLNPPLSTEDFVLADFQVWTL